MSKVKTVFGRSLSVGSHSGSYSYDNPAFLRGFTTTRSKRSGGVLDPKLPETSNEVEDPDLGPEDTDLDDESFRSDLERDSAHSSLVNQIQSRQYQQLSPQQQQNLQALAHELRYELLQREGNRRSSMNQWSPSTPQEPLDADQIELTVQDTLHRSLSERARAQPSDSIIIAEESLLGGQPQQPQRDSQSGRRSSEGLISSQKSSPEKHTGPKLISSQSQRLSKRVNERAPLKPSSAPPQRPITDRQRALFHAQLTPPKPAKPAAKLSNLFGLIDTSKLQSIFGNSSNEDELPYNPRYARQPKLETILEVSDSRRGSGDLEGQELSPSKIPLDQLKAKRYRTSSALFYGSLFNFIAGVLLLMSYASPYWLQSWEDTDSPFKNMGLWEFCFNKFRHPDYQFDKLFHGCHALYGEEYRLIREKLLPGWLMVVQLFVTLALITSYVGQGVIVALVLRYPLEIILRFEWHFCGFAMVCNGLTAVLLFLAMCIFGGMCWDRNWLLYPNYNFVSWSYAFVVFSAIGHIVAGVCMFFDLQLAKERKAQNRALISQMQPQGFGPQGSGYI